MTSVRRLSKYFLPETSRETDRRITPLRIAVRTLFSHGSQWPGVIRISKSSCGKRRDASPLHPAVPAHCAAVKPPPRPYRCGPIGKNCDPLSGVIHPSRSSASAGRDLMDRRSRSRRRIPRPWSRPPTTTADRERRGGQRVGPASRAV